MKKFLLLISALACILFNALSYSYTVNLCNSTTVTVDLPPHGSYSSVSAELMNVEWKTYHEASNYDYPLALKIEKVGGNEGASIVFGSPVNTSATVSFARAWDYHAQKSDLVDLQYQSQRIKPGPIMTGASGTTKIKVTVTKSNPMPACIKVYF